MHAQRWVWIAALGLALSSPAIADDASRLKTAREIVETTHAADNLKALLPQLMNSLKPMMERQGADKKDIDAFLKNGQARMIAQTGQIVDLVAAVYAREFSEDDLDNLLAFYKTPSGQHLIEKQVPIMRGMIDVGKQWGEMVAKETLDDFEKQKAARSTLNP